MFRSSLPRLSLKNPSQSLVTVPFLPQARSFCRQSPAFLPTPGITSLHRSYAPSQRLQKVFASTMAADGFSPRDWKDSEAHEVLPKVFLGSMDAAKDKESLKSHEVTHILTVNGKEPAFPEDFKYKVITFGGDNGPLTPHLDDSMAFVKEGVEEGGVLIHCTHGTGRSAAMTIAATMVANGDGSKVGSFTDAFRLVKARRPGTDPPLPFQEELGEWEKTKSS